MNCWYHKIIYAKNCRFNTIVTMTPIKCRKRQNWLILFSHVKFTQLLCHQVLTWWLIAPAGSRSNPATAWSKVRQPPRHQSRGRKSAWIVKYCFVRRLSLNNVSIATSNESTSSWSRSQFFWFVRIVDDGVDPGRTSLRHVEYRLAVHRCWRGADRVGRLYWLWRRGAVRDTAERSRLRTRQRTGQVWQGR